MSLANFMSFSYVLTVANHPLQADHVVIDSGDMGDVDFDELVQNQPTIRVEQLAAATHQNSDSDAGSSRYSQPQAAKRGRPKGRGRPRGGGGARK